MCALRSHNTVTAALTASLVASACAHHAPAGPAHADSADIFRFTIGALDAVALSDGDLAVANDGNTVGVGQPRQAVAELLAAGGAPTETIAFSIQPLLVHDGARILLFDTGAGAAPFAHAGHLLASLRRAGVDPAQITDIFISHGDPDHVGGLVTPGGALAFPGAAIHMSAPEWDAVRQGAEQPALLAVIAPKVATFQPGTTILPEVMAVDAHGHTPGHSMYLIGSGSERLLYIGDAAHHSIISVQRPDWTIAFDQDAATARTVRRALLQRAAAQHLRLYAVHFPFPGLGRVEAKGEGFLWIPEQP